MGLRRTVPTKRVTGKASLKKGRDLKRSLPFTSKQAQALLPSLHRYSQGQDFGVQAFRTWLRRRPSGTKFELPGVSEASQILRSLTRNRRLNDKVVGPAGSFKSSGAKYVDPEGPCTVWNAVGYKSEPRAAGQHVHWHEYGNIYRLRRTGSTSRETYSVSRTRAFKRMSLSVSKRTVAVPGFSQKAAFSSSVVFDPRRSSLGSVTPRWTFIYLHSFSNKGSEYADYPHYFGISGAAVRVVVPTAPLLEQTCFKDWNVWNARRLQWRRIKFNAWFDYLSDKAGASENDICLKSLLEMRERIHGLIRHEVQRVGDPRRVIIGGASQGCCVALDAAMTYPQELGGVIGLVGHILGSTPLDPAKRKMPLHLFHEASDQEMPWKWVKNTVKRLTDDGFNVTSKREPDPSGCGHWIQEIEGQWIRHALRQIVHSSGKSA